MRHFIDHPGHDLAALRRASLVGMVERTEEGAIPFGKCLRTLVRRIGEQTQYRRRVAKVGLDIEVHQSGHGNVVTDLSELDALKSCRVNDDEGLSESLH